MARIKIKDLPKEEKISKEELKKVLGGVILSSTYNFTSSSNLDQMFMRYETENCVAGVRG